MAENPYDFRKSLDEVHIKGRRDFTVCPQPDETVIQSGWSIVLPETASDFCFDLARDLADYLLVSMQVSAGIRRSDSITPESRSIILQTGSEELPVPRSFKLECRRDWIRITGADDWGTAQGSYHLEDLMNLREAPYIRQTAGTCKEPLFSPRLIHSGYGMDQFTAAYLQRIAHEGFDGILLYVLEPGKGIQGYTDFNEIIDLAEKAGIKVYFYSRMRNPFHPGDPQARQYYESQYGQLFRHCRKAAGLVLVGESCQFPSRDPMIEPLNSNNPGCFRSDKPNPGWWPCSDFPDLIHLIRGCIREYAPAADLIFWSYNWAFAPKELRMKLIDDLPGDVTLQVNFEMHDNIEIWGTRERALDYTLSLPGPSQIFQEEATEAFRRGLRLYTISNTAGKTWDFGCVPYLPTPYQWLKRMDQLKTARREVGLSGLMETHHFGWFPSFISEFAKWNFWSNSPEPQEILLALAAREFSSEVAETVLDAWREWSEAISEFVTPIEDQYGPCRLGPAFPFLFAGISLRSTFGLNARFPWTARCLHEIAFCRYEPVNDPLGLDMGIRRFLAEIGHLPSTIARWQRGISLLEGLLEQIPERKRRNARKMTGLARFIANTLTTTLHIKCWWLENQRLLLESDPVQAELILQRMTAILESEKDNVLATIPLVREDSSLGYEPSMDYVCDPPHLEWKLRQLHAVLTMDIANYRKGIEVAHRLELDTPCSGTCPENAFAGTP